MTTSPKTTKDEALKLALEILEKGDLLCEVTAASILREALAQPAADDADPNAPWLTEAHMLCSDQGIPLGHITARIRALRDKLDADDKAGGWLSDDVCSFCAGSGVVTGMTSHLGPDDYEFDTDCEACHGTGSADVRDAIKALSYQPHTVKTGVQMVDRAAVLRIIDAHVALLAAAHKAGGEADQGWKMVPVQATHNILAAAKQPGSWCEKWQRMVAASPNYTRPQPRADQPEERVAMTDEQAKQMLVDTLGMAALHGPVMRACFDAVRATEAAYGIKEQA